MSNELDQFNRRLDDIDGRVGRELLAVRHEVARMIEAFAKDREMMSAFQRDLFGTQRALVELRAEMKADIAAVKADVGELKAGFAEMLTLLRTRLPDKPN